MEVRITHLNRVKFSIQSRTHTILCDQPADDGGDDMGMTPPELFLASLGSCAAFYATQYLRTRSLAVTGVEVLVTAEKLKHPARLGNFRVQVTYPVYLTEEQTEGLMSEPLSHSQHPLVTTGVRDRTTVNDPGEPFRQVSILSKIVQTIVSLQAHKWHHYDGRLTWWISSSNDTECE
jgi:uncharacterized OsmC-like protein